MESSTETLCILSQSVDAHFSSALPPDAPIHGTFCSHLSNHLVLPHSPRAAFRKSVPFRPRKAQLKFKCGAKFFLICFLMCHLALCNDHSDECCNSVSNQYLHFFQLWTNQGIRQISAK